MLKEDVVKKNLERYVEQIGKIIDITKIEIHNNSSWLGGLTYGEIGRQADVFSLNEFISRDNIKRRLDAGNHISLRELLYPLMQGYDSVAVKADIEIGGTDQKFNLLAGRDLQREYGQEPQDIITLPLIEGLDGRKMSSSWGNTVNLLDTPQDMYGKLMTLKDEFIIKYFTILTRVPMATIEEYKESLANGENPRNIKMKLAFEIVRFYHQEDEARKAEEYFVHTFTNKQIPEEMGEFAPKDYNIVLILIESNIATSKTEARRLIEDGSVKINNETVTDVQYTVEKNSILQKGKRVFVKIV